VALGTVLVVFGVLGAVLRAAPDPAPSGEPTAVPAEGTRPPGQACGSSLQAVIDGAPAGTTLDLRGCAYTSGATIGKQLTLIGAAIRVPAGRAGITVTADDVALDGLQVTGPQSTAFVIEEAGVYARGTPQAPIRRLTIRNCTIRSFGGFGAYLGLVADLRLLENEVEDVVYAGLVVLSAAGGTIEGNTVRRIGVQGSEANGGNAYGIALTTLPAGDVPTTDYAVQDNTIEDVPTWHALDTHGGRRIVFAGNTVRRSMRGIFLTTDDAGNRPTDIAVVDNRLLSPAPVDTNLAAVTTYDADTVAILRNRVTGWGTGNFFTDFEDRSTRIVIAENVIGP